jgi:hypothetical protein
VIRFVFIAIAIVALSTVAGAQAKKRRTTRAVKATVTAKEDFFPDDKLPNESDKNIWNMFEADSARVMFPSKAADVTVDILGQGKSSLRIYSAETATASYKMSVSRYGSVEGNQQLHQVLDRLVSNMEVPGEYKVVEKKNVYFRGRLGKQVTSELRNEMEVLRVFILEEQLFVVSVFVEKKTNLSSLKPWIEKFLDSFQFDLRTDLGA